MPNEGRETSGTVTFASGDAGTAQDLLDIRDEETFSPTDIEITYSGAGTTEAVVSLYDEPSGTGAGSVNDKFDEYQVTAGQPVVVTGVKRRDIEDDVVAVVSGNDNEVSITIGGEIVTG